MKILISFSFQKDAQFGMGNAVVHNKDSVPSEKDLIEFKKKIKKFGKYEDITILNWIPLRED